MAWKFCKDWLSWFEIIKVIRSPLSCTGQKFSSPSIFKDVLVFYFEFVIVLIKNGLFHKNYWFWSPYNNFRMKGKKVLQRLIKFEIIKFIRSPLSCTSQNLVVCPYLQTSLYRQPNDSFLITRVVENQDKIFDLQLSLAIEYALHNK